MRIEELAKAADVTMRWRPFLLGAVFKAQGWPDTPFNLLPIKGRYMWRDLERICAGLGLPLRRPTPFPQHTVTAARIALIGHEEGWGVAFSKAAYRAEFGDGHGTSATAQSSLEVLRRSGRSPMRYSRAPRRRRQRRGSALRRMKPSASASSARRPSSPRTASSSGATTGWSKL